MSITPDKVSACLVTRGDVNLEPIINTLPYGEVLWWNNSHPELDDYKTFGRYMAMRQAKNDVVYFQDDDTIFQHHDELLAAYEPGMTTATYGHGNDEAGYGDLPLVCGGALAHKHQIEEAIRLYQTFFDLDTDFYYDCDFAIGVLVPFKQVRLPFGIRRIAYNGRRLADEPWQRETKLRICNRGRWIRDHVVGPTRTDSLPVPA